MILYLCLYIFCNLCLMACYVSVIVCTGTERAPEPLEAGPEVRPRAYLPVCYLPALLHLLSATLDPAFHVLLRCRVDLDLDNHILPSVTALLVAVMSAMVWGRSSERYILNRDSAPCSTHGFKPITCKTVLPNSRRLYFILYLWNIST